MLARRPRARRRVTEMRRASDRRLTANRDDTATPWTPCCGATCWMIWMSVGPTALPALEPLLPVDVGGFGPWTGAGGGSGAIGAAFGSNCLPVIIHWSVEFRDPSGAVTVSAFTGAKVVKPVSTSSVPTLLPPATTDVPAPLPK